MEGKGNSAELICPTIVDVGPKTATKLDETKPKMAVAVPTNRHKPIPIDVGPVCFHHNPELLNCEIAESRLGKGQEQHLKSP